MSSRSDSSEEKDECSICLNEIDPRGGIPLTIPGCCGAKFHSNCLQKSKEKSCPMCRSEIAIPKTVPIASGEGSAGKVGGGSGGGGGSGNSSEESSSSNNTAGDVCENCSSKAPAVSYCVDCSMRVCTLCKTQHSGSSRGANHEYVSIEESRRYVTRKCNKHKMEIIKYVCETCSPCLLCCQKCIFDDGHQKNGHEISSVEKYATKQRFEMQVRCLESEELLSLQEKNISDVDARIQLHTKNREDSSTFIANLFDSLLEMLENCKTSWLDDLESQGSSTATKLSAEKKMVQMHIANGAFNICKAKDMLASL